MILRISTHQGEKTFYRCNLCGKTRDYLSESWSTITIPNSLYQVHHCLECRSDKKEYRS